MPPTLYLSGRIDLDGLEPAPTHVNYGKNLVLGNLDLKPFTNKYLNDPKSKSVIAQDNTNWTIFPKANDNLQGAAEAITSLKQEKPNVKIQNIVLGAHAGHNTITGENGISYGGNDAVHKVEYIYLSDLTNYNNGKTDGIGSSTLSAIRNLQTIVNSIETGGNLYLNACHVDDKLGTAIAGLSDKKINVFFTSDEISMSAPMDQRRIPEGKYSYTWSPKQKTYIFRNENWFKKGVSSVSKGSEVKSLKKNIVLNSQGKPVDLPTRDQSGK